MTKQKSMQILGAVFLVAAASAGTWYYLERLKAPAGLTASESLPVAETALPALQVLGRGIVLFDDVKVWNSLESVGQNEKAVSALNTGNQIEQVYAVSGNPDIFGVGPGTFVQAKNIFLIENEDVFFKYTQGTFTEFPEKSESNQEDKIKIQTINSPDFLERAKKNPVGEVSTWAAQKEMMKGQPAEAPKNVSE